MNTMQMEKWMNNRRRWEIFSSLWCKMSTEKEVAGATPRQNRHWKGSRQQGYDKQHRNGTSKIVHGKIRQNLVTRFWHCYSFLPPQRQTTWLPTPKKEVDRYEAEAIGKHILARFCQIAAGEILLHDVLVQTGHHYHHKNTAKKLLEEIFGGCRNRRTRTDGNGHLAEWQ